MHHNLSKLYQHIQRKEHKRNENVNKIKRSLKQHSQQLSYLTSANVYDNNFLCAEIFFWITEKLMQPKVWQMMSLPVPKSKFGVMWPWPLTSCPQKWTLSSPSPDDHLCIFAAKTIHSFVFKLFCSQVWQWTNKQTNGLDWWRHNTAI